jgi:hypothetical protein
MRSSAAKRCLSCRARVRPASAGRLRRVAPMNRWWRLSLISQLPDAERFPD